MATTKNLCAQIPIDLHERVSEERERLGQTTSEYIANLIQDYSSIAPSAERMPPQADCALPALMSWHTGCCIRDCTAEPARVQP